MREGFLSAPPCDPTRQSTQLDQSYPRCGARMRRQVKGRRNAQSNIRGRSATSSELGSSFPVKTARVARQLYPRTADELVAPPAPYTSRSKHTRHDGARHAQRLRAPTIPAPSRGAVGRQTFSGPPARLTRVEENGSGREFIVAITGLLVAAPLLAGPYVAAVDGSHHGRIDHPPEVRRDRRRPLAGDARPRRQSSGRDLLLRWLASNLSVFWRIKFSCSRLP
jgi:hypothetical protein